jgi:outer membrane autotransporter protein
VTLDDMSQSAGEISIGVDSDTSFGTLVVSTGDLDFGGAGGLPTVTVGIGDLATGQELLIADGAGAITGGPGAVLTDVTDNSFIWDFQVADGTVATVPTDNTDLFLFVTQANNPVTAANTSGNASVATVRQGLSASTDPQIQQALTAMNSAGSQAELNTVLERLQPDASGGSFLSALGVTNTSMNIIGGNLASIRSGETPTGMTAGNISEGVRMWGQVFGATVEQDRRDNIAGFDADTYGFAVGIDSENVADNMVLGLSFAYGDTEVDSDNANQASTDVDSYQFTLYGDYDYDPQTYINGMLAYTNHNNDTTRTPVAGLIASGDFDADQFTARVEAGRDYEQEFATLTPNVMAHWTHYDPDAYTETGAGGLNTNVDGDSIDVFELGVGLDLSWEYQTMDGGYFEPELRARYRYDFVGEEVTTTSNFVGGGQSFRTKGFDPAQSTFNLGAGMKYYDAGNWEFTANYDYEFKSDYDGHSGFLRAGYKF